MLQAKQNGLKKWRERLLRKFSNLANIVRSRAGFNKKRFLSKTNTQGKNETKQ